MAIGLWLVYYGFMHKLTWVYGWFTIGLWLVYYSFMVGLL